MPCLPNLVFRVEKGPLRIYVGNKITRCGNPLPGVADYITYNNLIATNEPRPIYQIKMFVQLHKTYKNSIDNVIKSSYPELLKHYLV